MDSKDNNVKSAAGGVPFWACVKASIGQDSHRFCGAGGVAAAPHGVGGVTAHGHGGDDDTAVQPCGCGSVPAPGGRALVLGGVEFPGAPPLEGNSDADVVLHALCNAISGVTGVNILGETADRMCLVEGITDSSAYVREALKYLEACGGYRVAHASFSIECARPAISPRIREMRESVAGLLGIGIDGVGITATSGEGLTDFGRGAGIQVMCALTACRC